MHDERRSRRVGSLNDADECADRRSVRRSGSHMMEPDDTLRVDQDIAAKLGHISSRFLQATTTKQQLHVNRPCRGSQNVSPATFPHSVFPVKPERLIDEYRPADTGLTNIFIRQSRALERDHRDLHTQRIQPSFDLSQLRQVLTARQSAQMPVEHE